MPIDWALYEEDVLRLYVDEGRSISKTLKYLDEEYNVKIRQVDYVRS
jgi:hypothetical protein